MKAKSKKVVKVASAKKKTPKKKVVAKKAKTAESY